MAIKKWGELPEFMKNQEVEQYYKCLMRKKKQLRVKRVFDFILALILLVLLSPLLVILGLAIKLTSKGPIFFRQTRVTQYGKKFKIFKFRTMIVGAESIGSQVTVAHDSRVTKIGHLIRKVRLDEIPQLINVLKGEMSFVGTRPEVLKYVEQYTSEMQATLLMKAGITSRASIAFKDEEKLLKDVTNVDESYIKEVLPLKMGYNLAYIRKFTLWEDFLIMWDTVFAIGHQNSNSVIQNNLNQ